jgi:hypothetical protein
MRWLCGMLVALVLFTQLATAAYACPAAIDASRSMPMAEMPGCDQDMSAAMDADQPQLCKAHCQQGNQAVSGLLTADLVSWPVLVSVLDWGLDAFVPQGPVQRPTVLRPGASPPGSPPLYLSLLVLRN